MTHTWHASEPVLQEYAAGSLADADAWSVEMHLPGCDRCRTRLAAHLSESDRAQLAQLREALTPIVHPRGRPAATRLPRGVTTGVLGPWWAWAGLVAAAFATVTALGLLPIPQSASLTSWAVASAPLVPLAMVATIYALAERDPAVGATPRGGLELALIRTAVVLGTAVPAVTAALMTTGAGTVTWLLPGLGLCAAALALGPTVGFERACVGLTALWALLAAAAAPPLGLASAAALIEPAAGMQALWALAAMAAVGVVAARTDRFDLPRRLS